MKFELPVLCSSKYLLVCLFLDVVRLENLTSVLDIKFSQRRLEFMTHSIPDFGGRLLYLCAYKTIF